MNSGFLPAYGRNALYDCRKLLPRVLQRKVAFQEVLAFCRGLRVAGIADFFLRADAEALLLRLQQSGRAFAYFLAGAPEEVKVSSRSLPFFDAIASGDLEAAKEIARLSRRSWAEDEEYEEDFLFVEFLMQCFFLGAEAGLLQALLKRYREALVGTEDVRLRLCEALVQRDGPGFHESLVQFLSERADSFEGQEDFEAPEVLATEALFSVEGLALLRLAGLEGLSTEEDYEGVPSLARAENTAGAPPEAWQHGETYE